MMHYLNPTCLNYRGTILDIVLLITLDQLILSFRLLEMRLKLIIFYTFCDIFTFNPRL